MGKTRDDDPSKLTDFKMLSFDCYSTLIDEKGGMFQDLQPILSRLPLPNPYINDRTFTLSAFQRFEQALQVSQPSLPYKEILSQAYTSFANSLNLPTTSSEALAFASAIGSWPAFPDTVPALQALRKHYKLVLLSNIDNDSIARTLAGPLNGAQFDAVYTAQDIGSYKPDLANFRYLLRAVERDFGVQKGQVLHTAQSLTCDLVPAKSMGLTGVWIAREEEEVLLRELTGQVNFTWRFGSMGEMAAAVEKEFEGSS